LAAYLIFLSPDAASILLAIAIGTFVTGKIDNKYFILAFLIVSISGILAFFFDRLNIVAFFALFLGSALDELMHELSSNIKFPRVINWIFEYRFIMRFFAIALWLFNALEFLYLIAFFFWDLGYEMKEWFERKKIKP